MTTPLIALLVGLPLVLLTVALVRTLRADGYGHRPPPRSHPSWDELPAPPAADAQVWAGTLPAHAPASPARPRAHARTLAV